MSPDSPQPQHDEPIVIAPANDPRIDRAVARARHRLPEFLEKLRKQPEGVQFFVKVAIKRLDGNGHKHVWVRVTHADQETFVGTLESDPDAKIAPKAGEAVQIPFADIEDWMYDWGARKRVGDFSGPVLDQIERETHKRRQD